jgi:hypothetical protein
MLSAKNAKFPPRKIRAALAAALDQEGGFKTRLFCRVLFKGDLRHPLIQFQEAFTLCVLYL